MDSIPEGMKRCSRCSIVKPLDCFHIQKGRKVTGRQGYCKACAAEKQVLWNKARQEAQKKARLEKDILLPDYALIALTGKHGEGKYTKVSLCDYAHLSQRVWSVMVCRGGAEYVQSGQILMHREVTRAPKGVLVDHANRDTLDNQRGNLRLCDHRRNAQNSKATLGTSAYKGVSFEKRHNNWRVRISTVNGIVYVGNFQDEVEAAKAYDMAAIKHHGEFAWLNFP